MVVNHFGVFIVAKNLTLKGLGSTIGLYSLRLGVQQKVGIVSILRYRGNQQPFSNVKKQGVKGRKPSHGTCELVSQKLCIKV